MATWETKNVDILDDIFLDPLNVRLAVPDEALEVDIMADLFHNENAFELVQGIASVGYLTHELPIAIARDAKLFVVEGNRRLAALKAIQNPYLVPEFRARVERVAGGILNRDTLRKIEIKVAPSQDDANVLIASLHTSNMRRPWTPARQAAFFEAQIQSGRSIPQLRDRYPFVELKDFVTRSQILELFRSVPFSDPGLVDFLNQRRFPLSTLARLYENGDFQKTMGISISTDGEVGVIGDRARVNAVAEKVIRDIGSKRINTRVLNRTNSDSYQKYMDELKELVASIGKPEAQSEGRKPESSEGGSSQRTESSQTGRDKTSSSDGHGGSTGSSTTKTSPKRPPYASKHLDLSGISVPQEYPVSIGLLVEELMTLNIERYPNATLDLLRTFLEKLIKAYAHVQREDIRVSSNRSGYVYLNECLVWMEARVVSQGPTALAQVVRKIRGKGAWVNYSSSADHLNAINHNYEIVASATDVRDTWNTMSGLVKHLLA